jgi:hypothetical protein
MAFWLCLVHHGARVGGLRELHQFHLEQVMTSLFLSKQCWGSVTFWCGSGSVPSLEKNRSFLYLSKTVYKSKDNFELF